MDNDIAFITSAGRTGTTFLGRKLSYAIDNCASVHEPDDLTMSIRENLIRVRTFGIWHMLLGRLSGQTGLRPIGTKYLMSKMDPETCCEKIGRTREDYFASLDYSLVIESNPQWQYLIDLIPKIWPEAKIVVIIRDPRTWIQSWINKGGRHTFTDMVRYFPPGRLSPGKIGDSRWKAEWKSLDTFGRLAWEWQNVNHRLSHHAETNDRCRIFRYEELFKQENVAEMEKLLQFLSCFGSRVHKFKIPADFTQNRHHSSTGSFPQWPEWHPTQARQVDIMCGNLMRKFGYGSEPLWKQMLLTASHQ